MFSNRINNMKQTIFSRYTELISLREQKGISFYKLNMGQPDFETNSIYFESLSNYNTKTNKYGEPSGSNDLKMSVARNYNKLFNKSILTSGDIVITQGASDAIIKLLYTICDYNDEIIVLEPFFSDYKIYCDMLNIKIKSINWTDLNSNFFEKNINNKTRGILFSNPNNPDGKIMTKQIAKQIYDISKKHKLFIISDEVYSGLIYDEKYFSFINYLDENIVVVDSASKKLNLCGSRIGYIISKNKLLNNKIIMLNDCRISISNVEQYAVAKTLDKLEEIIEQSKNEYKNRIDFIQKKLDKTNIKCIYPHGGLTMLLEFPFETEKYVKWLIETYERDNCSIIVTPANDFYISNIGNNKIRICVTIDEEKLEDCINLLIESCEIYMEEVL